MPVQSQGKKGREDFGRGNNGTCYAQDGKAYDGTELLSGFGSQQERDNAAATAEKLKGIPTEERLVQRYYARVAAYDQQRKNQGEWSVTRQDYDLGRLTD